MSSEFDSLQKIVIPRRIQSRVPHTSSMYQHVIEVPQIDVGNIARQDFLNFIVKFFPSILIDLAARQVDQDIDTRVAVETAVCALGRESVGVEGVFKNVGIFVSTNPT